MADWAKILLKTGLVLGVMTGIWAVFTQIQIPEISYYYVVGQAHKGLAILSYWCPAFPIVWNFSIALFSILLALWTFRFASIAVRWLFKVNE